MKGFVLMEYKFYFWRFRLTSHSFLSNHHCRY